MFQVDIEEDELILGERFPSFCEVSACYYEHRSYLKKQTRIYSDTYCKEYVLAHIRNNPDKKYKVLFHNSDWSSPSLIPDNCLVFSQNVPKEQNENHKVFSLPIGLENKKWFPELRKIYVLLNHEKINPSKLCYCNFDERTNPEVRSKIFEELRNSTFTMDPKTNGSDYGDYVRNILEHQFVLSPPGNGIDCHRTWECLYLGRIPIVYDVYKNDLFDELPVLVIEDTKQLTREFLERKRDEILSKSHNFEKLKLSYWRRRFEEQGDI